MKKKSKNRLELAGFLIGSFLLATLVGTAWAGFETKPGRTVLTRFATSVLQDALHGTVDVDSVTGPVTTGLIMHNLTVRGEDGVLFAKIPKLTVRYRFTDFLARRVVFSRVILESPTVNLVKGRDGRFNYQEVLGLGGPAGDGEPPFVAFRSAEIRNGSIEIRTPTGPPNPGDVWEIEETDSGLVRVRRLHGLYATVPFVRIVSPFPEDHGLEFDIEELTVHMSDPTLHVLNLRGRLAIDGDSMNLDLEELSLPTSVATVNGDIRWPDGKLMLALDIDADTWSANDVRGLVKKLPWNMVGRGGVRLRSLAPDSMRIDVYNLALRGGRGGGRVSGRLGLLTGSKKLVAIQNADLTADNLSIDYLRPLLDSIPFAGRLTGRMQADGPMSLMDVAFDWTLRDSIAAPEPAQDTWPVTDLHGSGVMALGPPNDITFFNFTLDTADIALETIREIAPVVELQGRLGGSGRLNGPWKNLRLDGDLWHRHDTLPETRAIGALRLDTRRDTVGLFAELMFDSLRLEGVHPSYSGLPSRGNFAGELRMAGYTDSLDFHADLKGPPGELLADAEMTLLPSGIDVRGLDVFLTGFDLASVMDSGVITTELYGRVTGRVFSDSLRSTRATLNIALDTSFVIGLAIDSMRGRARTADSLVFFDEVGAWGPATTLTFDGGLGLSGGRSDTLRINTSVDSLGWLEPTLRQMYPQLAKWQLIDNLTGVGRASADIVGSVGDYQANVAVNVDEAVSDSAYMAGLWLRALWSSSLDDSTDLHIQIDSIARKGQEFSDLEFRASGPRRQSSWLTRARVGQETSLVGWGQAFSDGRVLVLPLDSAMILLPTDVWSLSPGAIVSVSDSGFLFQNFALSTLDGNSGLRLAGRFPRRGSAALRGDIIRFPLKDVWGLAQRNPRDVDGVVNGVFDLGGTAALPLLDGSLELTDARFGNVRVPLFLGETQYADSQLTGNYELIGGGDTVLMALDFDLPLNLALEEVPRRRLPGPISVRARADGADLSVVELLTRNVQNATGNFSADFGVAGTWDVPRLTGTLALADAQATFPSIGVTYEQMTGGVHLVGDSIVIDSLSAMSGDGTATADGLVRLEQLREPVLNLGIAADNFATIDVEGFTTFTTTGRVALDGPVFGATLTGSGMVTDGALYFADLIEKDIINLEDTLYASLLDPNLRSVIEREGLGRRFENRFLDSLRIRGLQLTMGSDVWLRSGEADIGLTGLLTVDKTRGQYRLDGTLNTPRGTYGLPYVASSDFVVTGGEVVYFGTPDLNAAVDIDAQQVIRTVEGENLTVFVKLGGTLYSPQLTLSSDREPPLPEDEIISYLLFRAPSVAVLSEGGSSRARQLDAIVGVATGALSSELERALLPALTDAGIGLDYFQIRPESKGSYFFEFGKQLSENWFFALSPRACLSGESFRAEDLTNFSLEYRLGNTWRFSVSSDPAQPCGGVFNRRLDFTRQVGGDIFWQKRY